MAKTSWLNSTFLFTDFIRFIYINNKLYDYNYNYNIIILDLYINI